MPRAPGCFAKVSQTVGSWRRDGSRTSDNKLCSAIAAAQAGSQPVGTRASRAKRVPSRASASITGCVLGHLLRLRAPRSGRSSGQRPNRQLVAARRHGSATVNSTHRLSLTLRSPALFMKCAAATSGHQFPLVRFPASRATLEFTIKFIVMSACCPCATAAPHTLRYIHSFVHL